MKIAICIATLIIMSIISTMAMFIPNLTILSKILIMGVVGIINTYHGIVVGKWFFGLFKK